VRPELNQAICVQRSSPRLNHGNCGPTESEDLGNGLLCHLEASPLGGKSLTEHLIPKLFKRQAR
jgi:hypothetical protein